MMGDVFWVQLYSEVALQDREDDPVVFVLCWFGRGLPRSLR